MTKKTIAAIVVTACYLFTNLVSGEAAGGPIDTYNEWDDSLKAYTKQVCEEYDVDYSLALAVIYNESRFQSGLTHKNTNGTTDYGLMQVNEVNYEYLHKTVGINSMRDLLNDKTGIRCGVELLAYHKDFTGEDSSALLRYQVGAGKYKKYRENGRYTNKTHSQVWQYKEIYSEYLTEQDQQNSESEQTTPIQWDRFETILNRWVEFPL